MNHRPIAEIQADLTGASAAYQDAVKRADKDAGSTFRLTREALINECRYAARDYAQRLTIVDIFDLAIERTSGGSLRGLLVSLNALIKDPDDAHDAKYLADRLAHHAREIAADPVATLADC